MSCDRRSLRTVVQNPAEDRRSHSFPGPLYSERVHRRSHPPWSLKKLLLPGSDIAKIRIERNMLRLAYVSGQRSCWRNQVVLDRSVNALAWVGITGVPVSLERKQDCVSQSVRGEYGIRVPRPGIIPIADDQDRVCGRGIPAPGTLHGRPRAM